MHKTLFQLTIQQNYFVAKLLGLNIQNNQNINWT